MTSASGKPTPTYVTNRAGLPAIRDRVGTHSAFLASLQRGLADANRPGLSELRSRAEGDYTLGLLDAWAAALDTLTFYGERQANEAYLRTATERDSIRAHARLIGYELAPAKAASTFLAFTAEVVNAPDETLSYPPGLQARSIPRDGQVPLTFETIEDLTARAAWNALRPRMAYPQVLTAGSEEVSLTADAPRLSLGDPVLLMQGEVPVAFGTGAGAGFLRRVSGLTPGIGGRRIVALTADPASAPAYSFLFYTIVPMWTAGTALTTTSLGASLSGAAWSLGTLSTTTALTRIPLFDLSTAISTITLNPADPIEPHVLRVRAGFFGSTAITKFTAPVASGTTVTGKAYTSTATAPGDITATTANAGQTAAPSGHVYLYLDREYPEVTAGQILLVRDPSNEVWVMIHACEMQSVEAYGLSAKVTRLEVDATGHTPEGTTRDLSSFYTRTAVALAVPERLPLSDLPITDPIGLTASDLGADQIELDTADLMLSPGKLVAITGERLDLSGVQVAEIRQIAENILNETHTVLTFTQPLTYSYLRDTVRLNANVAEATHGETQVEALGDGDATKPFQRFKLKSGPLTHVSARTASGMAPALEVRVDRVLWRLVDDFRDAGPDDAVYILRIEEDGSSRVVFGDGTTGRRLPTGQGNVTATYRRGAGLAGNLEAGQLSLLAGKPIGLKSVINPLAPAGGADAEVLEDARQNAPLKVLTLGRAVSLRDYADYARGFAAVAKARADWTFDGFSRPIYVTVAGQGGAILPEAGDDMVNLRAQLAAAGESDLRVTVRNYRPVGFGASAKLFGDPAYIPADIVAAATADLLDAFGFDARDLGQSVSHAQVIAVLQSVPGVLGVDLDTLYRNGEASVLNPVLRAAVARPDLHGAVPDPAELLTLDPNALRLEVAT
ncbi:MAG: putative baseplate assembly protein [Cypionkella sp.]